MKISFDLQKNVRRSRWIESLNVASLLNLNFHIETLRAILRCNASQNVRKTSQVASEEPVSHSTLFAIVHRALNSTESAINKMGKQ